MQSITFSIPRLYDDITFRVGGSAFETPYATILQSVLPFVQADFDAVNRRQTTETISDFFGIDNNYPAPPTLNGTGRGRNLLNAPRLSSLESELSVIYGIPNWLNLSLKDWIKYEMTKENTRWIALNTSNFSDLSTILSDFANKFQRAKAFVSKLNYTLKMPESEVLKNLSQSFSHFKILDDNAEYRKKYNPNEYQNADNKNLEVIEILLPKSLDIDYNKYLEFTQLGDKTVSLTGFNTTKDANDLAIDFYCQAPPALLPFANYPIFDLCPNLDYSVSGNYSISIFYDEKPFVESVPSKLKPIREREEKEEEEKHEESDKDAPIKSKPKTSNNYNVYIFLAIIILVIAFIILQKASQ